MIFETQIAENLSNGALLSKVGSKSQRFMYILGNFGIGLTSSRTPHSHQVNVNVVFTFADDQVRKMLPRFLCTLKIVVEAYRGEQLPFNVGHRVVLLLHLTKVVMRDVFLQTWHFFLKHFPLPYARRYCMFCITFWHHISFQICATQSIHRCRKSLHIQHHYYIFVIIIIYYEVAYRLQSSQWIVVSTSVCV